MLIPKQELREEISKLKKEIKDKEEQAVISFTKTELREFIKKEVIDHIKVEVREDESYQFGGGYEPYKEIGIFWDDDLIHTSTSFK